LANRNSPACGGTSFRIRIECDKSQLGVQLSFYVEHYLSHSRFISCPPSEANSRRGWGRIGFSHLYRAAPLRILRCVIPAPSCTSVAVVRRSSFNTRTLRGIHKMLLSNTLQSLRYPENVFRGWCRLGRPARRIFSLSGDCVKSVWRRLTPTRRGHQLRTRLASPVRPSIQFAPSRRS